MGLLCNLLAARPPTPVAPTGPLVPPTSPMAAPRRSDLKPVSMKAKMSKRRLGIEHVDGTKLNVMNIRSFLACHVAWIAWQVARSARQAPTLRSDTMIFLQGCARSKAGYG